VKSMVQSLLVVAVAAIGSMPVQAQAGPNGPCVDHGGITSAWARPVADAVDVTLDCADSATRGPFRYSTSGAVPCGDHGGVRAATARPGAGVIEVIIYCNDGQSEGPYVYEIR
jgi:hypothetical protein